MSVEVPELPAFALRFREARLRAGLTQRELGRRVGMEADGASARISQYETGIHQPYFPTAERIAKELGVPVAYLYADSERLARLILAFSALDATEQDRILAAVEGESRGDSST